jgi:hypothetical protein
MERELGISYWTVRRKLDELIEELGVEAKPVQEVDAEARQIEILEQVDRGEISAADAAEMLSRVKGPGSRM